jgi:hypothetical protein
MLVFRIRRGARRLLKRTRDHYHELASKSAALGNGGQLCRRAAKVFFKLLGQFTGQDDLGIRINLLQFVQKALNAMGGLIEHKRPGNASEGFEPAQALAALVWKETQEMKFVRGKPTGGEGSDKRARSRHGLDSKARVEDGANDAVAWITDARAARVGHESKPLLLLETFQDLGGATGFIEMKATQEWLVNLVVMEESSRVACVFRDDDVALAQRPKRAQGDVLQVADGSCHEVKRGCP